MASGKCPKCETATTAVQIESVDIREGPNKAWLGIMLLCPSCRTILGISIDPVALKTEIIDSVTEAIRVR